MASLMFVNKSRRGAKKRRASVKARPRVRARVKRRRRAKSRALAAWSGNSSGHSRAAVKGYRRKGVRAKRRGLSGFAGNPSPRNLINGLVMPAATAAAGALAVDVAYGFLPVPDSIKSGPLRYVAKGAGAVLMGVLVGKVNRKLGDAVAMGGLTVTLHSAMRDMLARFAPGVALGAYASDMAAIGWDGDDSSFAGFGYQDPDGLGYQVNELSGVSEDYTDAMHGIDYDG